MANEQKVLAHSARDKGEHFARKGPKAIVGRRGIFVLEQGGIFGEKSRH